MYRNVIGLIQSIRFKGFRAKWGLQKALTVEGRGTLNPQKKRSEHSTHRHYLVQDFLGVRV